MSSHITTRAMALPSLDEHIQLPKGSRVYLLRWTEIGIVWIRTTKHVEMYVHPSALDPRPVEPTKKEEQMNQKVWVVLEGERLCVTVWGHRPHPTGLLVGKGEFLVYAGSWRWVQVDKCEPYLSVGDVADLHQRV